MSCTMGHMSKATTMKATDYLLSGFADLKAQTPWAHCPMTYDEWYAGAEDTPESLLYWEGWNGGLNDVYAAAQRAA